LPVVVAILLWIVVVALGVVALMRVVAWDDVEPFAVLNAVTAFVYLPAWIVLVVASIGRRFLLAAVALLAVVAQLVFVLPELTAAEPVPAWTVHAPAIQILDANVYNDNRSMAGYAAEIKSIHPDLVTMEEATPPDVVQLIQSGALDHFTYRFEIRRFDPTAVFIASRYPLGHTNVVSQYHRPLVTQTTLELPSGPQVLWVVHTTAPLPAWFQQWNGQLTRIADLVHSRGPSGLLVVGDFNATWGNRGFRAILATGLTDAAAARGRPFEMTWSQTKPLLPPLVRIDHILTGPGVAVTEIRTDDGAGSDHRDLIATVALDRPPRLG
jgi:endonuclease/exonuclease/phosphatase (EEP) superfamily protein YafD